LPHPAARVECRQDSRSRRVDSRTRQKLEVLGRDRIDPLISDYRLLLTKIRNLGAQALYCRPSALTGVKLVKQSYEIMPDMIKAGRDGLHQASILSGAGFPAAQGWYSTIAAPHMLDYVKLSVWLANYQKRWRIPPSDDSITA
jgi:branched-chain amino acid transport system substrate-binding protein